MPAIKITCSGKAETAVKEKLALSVSKLVAKLMNKPEAYVQALVEDGAAISFGGSVSVSSAFVVVRGIGGFSPEVNQNLSKAICEELSSALGIPPERTYINFESFKGSDWGWNSSTF